MKENEVKSEFVSKVEAFANEISNEASVKSGKKRGIIIIATEADEEQSNEETEVVNAIITVSGNGFLMCKGIAEFASRPETRGLMTQGMKMAAIKAIAKHINDINE